MDGINHLLPIRNSSIIGGKTENVDDRPWHHCLQTTIVLRVKLTLQQRFGRHVRAARKELRLSQEEFADRCGLDRTYISGIERGVRNPTLTVISIIAGGLGVSLSQLFSEI